MSKVERGPRVMITLDCGSAAFEESPSGEIGRILRDLAQHIQANGPLDKVLLDRDGLTVGEVTWGAGR